MRRKWFWDIICYWCD